MAPSYTPYTHQHLTLGSLTGRLTTQPIISPTAQVVQFRSVPFATIPARFKLAHGPLTTIPEDYDTRPHRDFTQWGYACPQFPQDMSAGGGTFDEDDVRQYDEFACLNCTISVPEKALKGELKGLPVMVYVHGGAFVEGCGNISAHHDTSRMVALSVEEGMPVVIVSLHYRLNWFGFFTCSDLLAEARDNGDGFVANLGLRDQRLGFQWVRQQIAGFGGDPANITALGESGGAISLTHHLCGTEPLFHRVILQSGTVQPPGPTLEERDAMYERLLHFVGIAETTPSARLRALRSAPVDKLIEAVTALKLAPAWPYTSPSCSSDDPFYAHGGPPRWSTIPHLVATNPWCTAAILGDSSFEGFMILSGLLAHDTPTRRHEAVAALRSLLRPADADALCNYYNLHPTLPANRFWTNTARLLGDMLFSEPTDRVVRGLASSATHRVYRYQVCLSNPFPGSMFSFVAGHHFVEVMYLFLTYLERYPTHRGGFFAEVAKEMARKWIAFANGRAPWEEHTEGTGYAIAVFDDLRGLDLRTRERDVEISKEDVWGERRYEGNELIRRALEITGDGDAVRGVLMEPFRE